MAGAATTGAPAPDRQRESRPENRRVRPRGTGSRPAGTDLLALGVVLALLSAIAFAFGGESGTDGGNGLDPPLTVLVVDVSPSMLEPRPGIRRWLLRKVEAVANEARTAGHELALVTFAERATRRFEPGPADEFFAAFRAGGAEWFRGGPMGPAGTETSSTSDDEEPGSDLSGAILVALNLHRMGLRARGQTVLIGDGTFTGDDPSELFSEPRLGALRWVEPEPGTKPDLEVVRVRAPQAIEPGVPIRCQVDLRLAHGRALPPSAQVRLDWTLRVTSVAALERGRNRPVWSQGHADEPVPAQALWVARRAPVVPAAGVQQDRGDPAIPSFSLPLVLPEMKEGSGELVVTATLLRAPSGPDPMAAATMADAFPETNHGRTEWTVGDPTRVLIVAPSQSSAAEKIAALFVGPAYDGIEFLTAEAGGIVDQLAGARPPHVILTSGLPLAALPGPALSEFVLKGGGWFHSEGWSSLRDDGGVLSPLLALKPDVEPRGPRNIVFIVDGSGSMKGPRWKRAKYALAQLLPSIPPEDRLELRFFTQVLGEAHIEFEAAPASASLELRAERRRSVMSQLRDLEIPGGSTDIIGSVTMFMREREKVVADGDERTSLVIVISDGRSTVSGKAPKSIRSTLMEFGDEIVAIQVGGKEGFRGPLSELAGSVENVVLAGELRGVLGILQEAVQGAKPIENARVNAARPQVSDRASEFSSVLEEATRLAQLETPLVIWRALPCREADGATPVFELESEGALPEEGATGSGEPSPIAVEPRRGVFAAIASRGRGMTAGIALPMLDPDGERWAPEFERRPQWMAPIFREMRQRFEQAGGRSGSLSSTEPSRASAVVEGRGSAARIVVRGLPPRAPAEIRAALRLVGSLGEFRSRGPESPLPSTVVAELRLEPITFGAGGGSTRAAPRPPVLDRYPRGTAFELELLGAGMGSALTLSLQGDGSMESDPSLQPLGLLRSHGESTPLVSFAGGAASGGASGDVLQPGGGTASVQFDRGPAPLRGAGHPVAPWLALGACLALFLGALGGQSPWRRPSRAAR